MNFYLAIITTVLVVTQIVRVTQNTIQLHRQNKYFQKQVEEVKDLNIEIQDIEMQRKAYRLIVERLSGDEHRNN